MKTLYIIAIILAVAFGAVDIAYIKTYNDIWSNYFFSSLFGPEGASALDDPLYRLRELTFEAAVVSGFFLLFFVLTFSFTLAQIKRTTAKVISILGLCFTGLFLLALFVPLTSPGNASWDEFGPALILLILVLLAFSIVNLVQAIRNSRPNKISNDQTIDDLV